MSENDTSMKVDPNRAKTLASNLNAIVERITSAANGRDVSQLLPAGIV